MPAGFGGGSYITFTQDSFQPATSAQVPLAVDSRNLAGGLNVKISPGDRRCPYCSKINPALTFSIENRVDDMPGGLQKVQTQYVVASCAELGCQKILTVTVMAIRAGSIIQI